MHNWAVNYICLFFIILSFGFSQEAVDSITYNNGRPIDYEERFTRKLQEYILEQESKTYQLEIDNEAYLIALTHHVIDEVKKRHPNYKYARTSYFKQLRNYLYQTNKIILRLREKGVTDLTRFARELRERLKEAIKSTNVEYRLEKFFERSLQLLLIAEKAISGGKQSEGSMDIQEFDQAFRSNLYDVRDSSRTKEPDPITLLTMISEEERMQFTHYITSVHYIEKYQKKLISTGTKRMNLRFAKDLYERALTAYNYNRYELATRIFENFLDRFTFVSEKIKNRALYLNGLSYYYANQYSEAEVQLNLIINKGLADRLIISSLADVYTAKKDMAKLVELLKSYESYPENSEIKVATFHQDFFFKVGRTLFNNGEYSTAIQAFSKIKESYDYFHDAKLFVAMSRYALDPEEGFTDFDEMLRNTSTPIRIGTQVVLKRAQVAYDKREYALALDYLAQLDGEISEDLDEYYTTKAWSLFHYIHSNDSLEKDYTEVRQLIRKFLLEFRISDYITEMRTLLGYIHKLEENLRGAESEYRYVFDLKRYKRLSDELLREEDSLKLVRAKIANHLGKAVDSGDKKSFRKLDDLAYKVDTLLIKLKYSDQTSVSPTSYQDISRIYDVVNEMERLRERIDKEKNKRLLDVVNYKLRRLYNIILKTDVPEKNPLFGYNFFFEHGLSRKISKNHYLNLKNEEQKKTISKEIAAVNARVKELEEQQRFYRKKYRFEKVAEIEIALTRLRQALYRYDFILTLTEQKAPIKDNAKIDEWANYSAYELTNVQFVQKTELERTNSEMSNVIRNIDQSLKDRKTVMDQKIQTIEKTIALMNRRILKEKRIAERERNKKLFETQFFDESKTEIDEDSVRRAFEQQAIDQKMGRGDTLKTDTTTTPSENSLPEDQNPPSDDSSNKKTSSLLKEEEN